MSEYEVLIQLRDNEAGEGVNNFVLDEACFEFPDESNAQKQFDMRKSAPQMYEALKRIKSYDKSTNANSLETDYDLIMTIAKQAILSAEGSK